MMSQHKMGKGESNAEFVVSARCSEFLLSYHLISVYVKEFLLNAEWAERTISSRNRARRGISQVYNLSGQTRLLFAKFPGDFRS